MDLTGFDRRNQWHERAREIISGVFAERGLTRRRTLYVSHPWSLGDYEQTLGRMDRPGQTRSMTYIHLVAAETVDERVMEALADKRGVAEAVMGELHARGERT